MSDGCFSWCRPLRRYQGTKRQSIETEVSIDSCYAISLTQSDVQENPLAIVEVTGPVPVANISKEPESDEVSEMIHALQTLTSI